jgi:hypothetical protein
MRRTAQVPCVLPDPAAADVCSDDEARVDEVAMVANAPALGLTIHAVVEVFRLGAGGMPHSAVAIVTATDPVIVQDAMPRFVIPAMVGVLGAIPGALADTARQGTCPRRRHHQPPPRSRRARRHRRPLHRLTPENELIDDLRCAEP